MRKLFFYNFLYVCDKCEAEIDAHLMRRALEELERLVNRPVQKRADRIQLHRPRVEHSPALRRKQRRVRVRKN